MSVCALHECVDVDSGSEANNNKRLFYAFICIQFNLFSSSRCSFFRCRFYFVCCCRIRTYVDALLLYYRHSHKRSHRLTKHIVCSFGRLLYSHIHTWFFKSRKQVSVFGFFFSVWIHFYTCFFVDAAISCFSHFWFALTSKYIEFNVECEQREREIDWSSPFRDA